MRDGRLRALTGTAAALAVLLVASCGTSGDQPGQSADVGLVHVHGLGVDPSDGMLYAATHSGLFRVPEQGTPTRVGASRQDTMGFTVAGPRYFLGSGHPAPGEDRPSHLGLIESADAGASWRSLSLAGQVDFHALEYVHGQVYGYDSQSGRLLVSVNKTDWDRRATLRMADFAVSPASPDVLVATTQQGLAASADGGRTFIPVSGTPALVFISWPAAEALYGITASGVVQASADGGKTWQQRATLAGQPEALTATSATAIYATTDTGIYASTDGGRTFSTRYRMTGK